MTIKGLDRHKVIVDAVWRFWPKLLKYTAENDPLDGKRPYDAIIASWLNEFHGFFRDGTPTDEDEVQQALLFSPLARQRLWVNASRTVAYVDDVRSDA
jgi:hypothetical protein